MSHDYDISKGREKFNALVASDTSALLRRIRERQPISEDMFPTLPRYDEGMFIPDRLLDSPHRVEVRRGDVAVPAFEPDGQWGLVTYQNLIRFELEEDLVRFRMTCLKK